MSDGKDDTGKLRMSLATNQFAIAIKALAKVLTFGANKYPDPDSCDRSWVSVPNAQERYFDALDRHLIEVRLDAEHARGFNVDTESGLLHIDHAICNLMFLRKLLYGDIDVSAK